MATIQRRKTFTAVVGGVRVGSDAPVVVQSMTNTDTADVNSTVQQVAALARAGSELVRVTVNNDEAAAAAAPRPSRRPQPQIQVQPVRREGPKIGRNDPCPCGSGQKFKKCHGAALEDGEDAGGDDATA